ncbi:MAG: hypothetical protein WCL38_08990, partial [Actinomycetota bacterium]
MSTVVAVATAAGSSPLEAPLLAMLGSISCGSPNQKRAAGPLMYTLSPFAPFGLNAMLFGNIGLSVAASLIVFLAGFIISKVKRRTLNPSLVKLRFPSLNIKIAAFLLNGVSFAAFVMLQEAAMQGIVGLGWLIALVALGELVRR